ncbi:MFS transporter [Nakamurella flavida]|uniref:MFS transporter n=1 Tax=Nakamurella flavida TaxID=363630 RepID=A0A938YIB7_9ACTN|nr:MFS transporter [Nakamurella flavida]MBM9478220.1 MFS transporter [Nakamurella flavida]MDP9778558.1 EmrB/QacA subfamily drug resistance transporter [Nakamurella flavida]
MTGTTAGDAVGFRRPLALLVAGAYFMEILDGTIIAPAAPAIAADLGVAPVDVNIVLSAYLLTLAVLIPTGGHLSDRFGARRVFTTALVVFTLASLGCALASSLPMLTATRVLQGVGGALMVPVGRLVVLRGIEKTDLVRAIAYLTWPALLAPVLAPAVGGLLSTYIGWQWIFLINLPLGVAGVLVARRVVPDVRADTPPRFDTVGFLLLAGGLAALVVAIERVGTAQELWSVGGGALLGAVLLTLAVRHLVRTPRPLIDLRILRIGTFRTSATAGTVYRLVVSAVPFLLPLLFQIGFGWTAAQAGAVVIALFVGNVAIKPATTPLMRLLGIRGVLLLAALGGSACLVGMVWVRADTPLLVLLPLLVASGVFRSIGFTGFNSVTFADVGPADLGSANTLNATLQEVASGAGIALGALLVRLGGPVAERLGFDPEPGTPYRVTFVVMATVLLATAAAVLRMPRSAGRAVTGHRRPRDEE